VSGVHAWVEAHADEITVFLRELVRRSRSRDAQEVVKAFLSELGVEGEAIVPVDPERPVLVARVEGRGRGRSLILNGHVDVVGPGDEARWTQPPFPAELVDGRVVGRGAADAKGPLAALLFGLACARELSGGLAGDVSVVSVADEEVAGPGTEAALAAGHVADAAVVAEPTGLAVAPASRGAVTFRLEIDGAEAHAGAAFLGVNAIEKAMLYVDALSRLQARLDEERPHPLYAGLPVTHALNVATIRGGEFPGVVPRACELEAVLGCVATEKAVEAKAWVEEAVAATSEADEWLREHPPRLTWLREFEPGLTPSDHPFVLAALAAGERALGGKAELVPFLGGSDLRHFSAHGVPAVHIGPGNLLEAHGYDESVAVAELLDAVAFAAELVLAWCR
jgi:acetylornithine deacetylase